SYYLNVTEPSNTTLYSVTNLGNSSIRINWQNNSDTKLDKYCTYQSRTGQSNSFSPVSTSTKSVTSQDFSGLDTNSIYYFYISGQNKIGIESSPSSTYSVRVCKNKSKILIVCDPNSYPTFYSDSLGEYFPFDYCYYYAVDSGFIDLKQYKVVIWYSGSYYGRPDSTSRSKIQNFLENGGNLFLSGSYITQSLGYTGFPANYLKAVYQSSANSEYSIYGQTGTVFDGKNFGITTWASGAPSGGAYYTNAEVISSSGASTTCLKYNSGGGAGVQYSGTFGTSTTTAKLIYFSFPFECIASRENRRDVIISVMKFFGFDLPAVSNASVPVSVKGNSLAISGSAGANDTVYVYVNDELVNTIQCDSTGKFELMVAGKLKFGENNIKIVTVDSNGIGSKPVTYKVTYSVASENLKSIKVYPNPFLPSNGHKEISFANLPLNCEIKIFNIAGEIIKSISETNNYDSLVKWSASNDSGVEVASGIYIYHIEDKNTGEKKTGKVMIIR
ncbi:MAG: T9SS type A sorting domain-containing protein, partial [Elusimicrobiota bacterium]